MTSTLLNVRHGVLHGFTLLLSHSKPGHDTGMADRWLPDLSDLSNTDMALQINMRMGAHQVGRIISPVRSVTPTGWPSCRIRPSTDAPTEVYKTGHQTDEHPSCVRPGCLCPSTWNGKAGQHCCRTCQRGKRCAEAYHPHPVQPGKPHGRHRPDRPHAQQAYPHCVTPGCPCTV